MNLSAMKKDWRNEGKGIPLTTRAISNVMRGYTQYDVDNMVKQVAEGATWSKAAKANNIPRGSVSRLIPRVG